MSPEFNPWEPQHGYIGIILLCLAPIYGWWTGLPGTILVLDEIGQIFIWGQHEGPVHWLYINALYRIKFIKKLDDLINEVFMKLHMRVKVMGAVAIGCIILYLILNHLHG